MRSSLPSLLLLSLAGCDFMASPTELPLVGTFSVHGTLRSNTCSYAAFPAENLFQREAILRGIGDSAAKFQWVGMSGIVPGSATAGGTYQFQTNANVSTNVVDPLTGQPTCGLIRHTQVSVVVRPAPSSLDGGVDAGADAGSTDAGDGDAGNAGVSEYTLTGVYTEDIYASPGSDCSPLLAANGGQFAALPCTVTYDVTGTAPR